MAILLLLLLLGLNRLVIGAVHLELGERGHRGDAAHVVAIASNANVAALTLKNPKIIPYYWKKN